MGEKQLWKLIYSSQFWKATLPHDQIAKSQYREWSAGQI